MDLIRRLPRKLRFAIAAIVLGAYMGVVGGLTLFVALLLLGRSASPGTAFGVGVLLGALLVVLPQPVVHGMLGFLTRWWLMISLILVVSSLDKAWTTGRWESLVFMALPILMMWVAWWAAHKGEPLEVIGVFWGLGAGGSIWLFLTCIMTGGDGSWIAFLRAHIFDGFTAGGLAGFALYVAGKSTWPKKEIVAVMVLTLLGVLTAFSLPVPPVLILFGALCAFILGFIAIRTVPPLVEVSSRSAGNQHNLNSEDLDLPLLH